jgi:hypothetical protein
MPSAAARGCRQFGLGVIFPVNLGVTVVASFGEGPISLMSNLANVQESAK